MGSTKDKNNTTTIESRIQRCLVISESVYKQIWPSGSQRQRIIEEGLLKSHKKDIPLCYI